MSLLTTPVAGETSTAVVAATNVIEFGTLVPMTMIQLENRGAAWASIRLGTDTQNALNSMFAEEINDYDLQMTWVHWNEDGSIPTQAQVNTFAAGQMCGWVIRSHKLDPTKWYMTTKSYTHASTVTTLPETPWKADIKFLNKVLIREFMDQAIVEYNNMVVDQANATTDNTKQTWPEYWNGSSTTKKVGLSALALAATGFTVAKLT